MDPMVAAASLAPLVIDLGKAFINRFVSPDSYRPKTVEEWAVMRKAETDLFAAMNAAPPASYPWVNAVIALQRPVVAGLVLGVWGALKLYGVESPSADNFAGAIGFYLFGDRTLFHLRPSVQKGK